VKPITFDVQYWAPKRPLERITVESPEDAITNLKELLLHPDVSGVQMTVEKHHPIEAGWGS
jgi:hypothetical protein